MVAKGGAQLLPGQSTHRVRALWGWMGQWCPVTALPKVSLMPPPVPPGLMCWCAKCRSCYYTKPCWQLHLFLLAQGSGAHTITPSVVLPLDVSLWQILSLLAKLNHRGAGVWKTKAASECPTDLHVGTPQQWLQHRGSLWELCSPRVCVWAVCSRAQSQPWHWGTRES